MSYQQLLEVARALLLEYNGALTAANCQQGAVDCDKFAGNLVALGATNEADLASLQWEQILKCLEAAIPVPASVPPQKLARKVADVFRQGKQEEEAAASATPGYVSEKKASKMSLRQLVENFDPEEPNSPVGKRLSDYAKGRPFIVYKSGREVDIDATFAQISALKAGHPPMDIAMVNGAPTKVWRLGELPDNFAEENPLYSKRPLRPDGTCDQTLRSYTGVPKEVRQFLRVALMLGDKNGGFSINSVADASNHIDEAVAENAMTKLRAKYPRVSVKFDEMAKRDELPKLEIELASPKDLIQGVEGAPHRPFEGGQKVTWTRGPGNSYTPVDASYWANARRGRIGKY